MKAQNDKQEEKRMSLLLSAVDHGANEPDGQFLDKLKEQSTAEFFAFSTDGNKHSEKTIPISIWRIIMKSKITKLAAAAVIMVAVILSITFLDKSATPASAAEQLEQIIKLNENYKGWLHITLTHQPLTQKVPKDEPLNKGVMHMSTIDGTMIMEMETDHELKIQYYSPADEEYVEYSSLKNEVIIYDLDSFPAKQLVESYPLTVDASIALFKKATGRDPFEVTLRQEGDYDRFDVRLFENEEEAIRVGEETHSVPSVRVTLWVDANTHLIYKSITELQDKKILSTVKYGEPIISDIYDIGVSEDTVVVDHRKSQDVESVLDRLENRIADLNHYAAMMTETPLNDDGTFNKEMCALHLFTQYDDAWLANRYLVGVNTYSNQKPRASIMETPETWPFIEMMTMLEKIKYVRPSEFFVYDGKDFWSKYMVIPKSTKNKTAKIDRIKRQMGIANKIWFGNRRAYGPGTKIKLLKKEDGSNQIGLHIEFFVQREPSWRGRVEEIYWFDPTRDDMPAERLARDYIQDGKTIETEFHTLYLNYLQLPDGRWYPTHWQTTTIMNPESDRSRRFIREYHLYIYPDMELDKDWFTNPIDRLKN